MMRYLAVMNLNIEKIIYKAMNCLRNKKNSNENNDFEEESVYAV